MAARRAGPAAALVAGLLLLAAASPRAHHSFAAEFDASQPLTLKGTVARVDLVNPHAWLYVEVRADDGEVEHWNVEMGAPNALIRRGVSRQTIPIGAEVTVEGYRAKDGSRTMNGRTVTLANGQSLFTGSSNTGAPGER
jgi:hypothetical protein